MKQTCTRYTCGTHAFGPVVSGLAPPDPKADELRWTGRSEVPMRAAAIAHTGSRMQSIGNYTLKT